MMDLTQKKRYLTKAQCKATAARLSQEMREDREGRKKWGRKWIAYTPNGRGKKPFNLIFPGDMEAGKVVIECLYHPEEAAIIIEHLTDGSQK
jgi:hypothetical protein